MNDLDNLYAGHKLKCDNGLCDGCTILQKSKPVHAAIDDDVLRKSDVLFLSDSYKHRFGKVFAFSDKEKELIQECFSYDAQFSTSVKCPSVKEGDMSPDNMKICRQHLNNTVQKVQPKLIFVCGNLAMKMLIKKSGITDKRGKSFEYTTEAGHTATVVPIFHPYSVSKEPRHRFLFESDIKNAYEKYVLCKESEGDFSYKTLMNIEDVKALADTLKDSTETYAMDIETTGLNFLKDKIQTIAISSRDTTWVIPCDHKDTPFTEQPEKEALWRSLRKILESPTSRKVFHNAKFDLKFLMNYGIYTKNVWDTKIMHHLLDENLPKSLMDLVKLYFPSELESL